MPSFRTMQWAGGKLRLLDQTRLPHEEVYLDLESHEDVARAIREMRVRGAPAIGVAAAYGIALGAAGIVTDDPDLFHSRLDAVCETLLATRPTAVNLAWAVQRMRRVAAAKAPATARQALLAEAQAIEAEDEVSNRRLGTYGAALLPASATVLTHCNAGSLATAGYGTALGVLRAAREQGKQVRVYADETRPLLQGARLTAWELQRDGFCVTLITDSMAGYFIHKGIIDCVIVGADRIAANGDVANKIGTYALAVLAKENRVPFYVAAPTSTIDLATPSGDDIPIEERSPEEVTRVLETPIAPQGVKAANPAFDVTPAQYVTAIITEHGIARPPYMRSLAMIVRGRNREVNRAFK
ncbi:MAG: S-methyl-5-thioribose-1-phosphate isomerase [Chloroflexi bacterium]|nr:S-methyl-5-thioribose-1-phosphate isomerase [Chloroflexota bacterium]